MVNHVWSVLCEQTLQNPKNGVMSYINALDSLPVNSVNKKTGELSIKPFIIATKWKKNPKDKVKLFIQIHMINEESGKTEFFPTQEVELTEGVSIAALNVDITQMIMKEDSHYCAFEVMYKYNKQRNYRSAAVLPFIVERPKETGVEKIED